MITNKNRSYLISPRQTLAQCEDEDEYKVSKIGKEVNELVTCIDKCNVKKAICNLLSDKMLVKLHIFCTSIKY